NMNASSESGLWATWMVRVMAAPVGRAPLGPAAEVWSVGPGGPGTEVVQHVAVVHVLGPAGGDLALPGGGEIGKGGAERAGVPLDLGDVAADDVGQEVARSVEQHRVGQRERLPDAAHLRIQHCRVVALIV